MLSFKGKINLFTVSYLDQIMTQIGIIHSAGTAVDKGWELQEKPVWGRKGHLTLSINLEFLVSQPEENRRVKSPKCSCAEAQTDAHLAF